MTEIFTDAYFGARSALLEALPGLLAVDAGEVDRGMDLVEAFFAEADQVATTIIEAGAAKTREDRDEGADANEEGDQIVELVSDVLSILNDAVVSFIAPDGALTRLLDLGPDLIGGIEVAVAESRHNAFLDLLDGSLPALTPADPSQLATFAPGAPAPTLAPPGGGSGSAPSTGGAGATPSAGLPVPDPEVMRVATHIFDKTGAHVGEAVLGGAVSGMLDMLDASTVVVDLLARMNESKGPLLKRLAWRAARSVAGWISDLFASAGALIGHAGDMLVGAMKRLHTSLGMPIVRNWAVLDYGRTIELLSMRPTSASPRSVQKSFDKRMHTLGNGGKAVSVIVSLAVAAPGAGLVIAVVSSLIAIWLASDHLGVNAGILSGRPDWHHPDFST